MIIAKKERLQRLSEHLNGTKATFTGLKLEDLNFISIILNSVSNKENIVVVDTEKELTIIDNELATVVKEDV